MKILFVFLFLFTILFDEDLSFHYEIDISEDTHAIPNRNDEST